jgi:hypothetical protein
MAIARGGGQALAIGAIKIGIAKRGGAREGTVLEAVPAGRRFA